MINQSTKLATELFHTTQPEVEKLVTDVLVKHATSRDVTLALTYLMEQVQTYHGGCPKMKVRKFNPRWIYALQNLMHYDKPVHRSNFMELAANDFSIMKYWGLICSSKKGYWQITPFGKEFFYGIVKVPDSMLQCGIRDGRYKNNPAAKMLSFDDILNVFAGEG